MANCNPGTRQYIGARYVPRHMGEWKADTQYSAMDVVLYTDGNSYTAKCYPPKGTVPTDDKYWSLSAQFNQQLAALMDNIERLEKYEGGFINFKTFGGSPDNDDNSPMLATAITMCASVGKGLFINSGEYIFKSQVNIPQGFKIYGVEKNFDSNYGTVLKKEFNGDFLICSGYTEIGCLSIDGGNYTGAALTIGGRSYIHDVYLYNCEKGIACGVISCNLARIARIVVTGCTWAVYLDNTNELNGQSISFYDIDVRNCEHALYLNQPSNKFYNFCAQVMRGEGPAIKMGVNAKNNIFYGSYLESGFSNEVEVDLTGAQYNKFTGCRVTQYVTAFANNDGTNIVEARSLQNANVNCVTGAQMFDELTVCTKYSNNMPASGVKITKGQNDELILLKPNGTGAKQTFVFENVDFDKNTFSIGGMGKIQGGKITRRFQSFTNQSYASYSTSIVDNDSVLIMVSNTKGVAVTAVNNGVNWEIQFYNYSGSDLSNQDINFSWFSFKIS